MKKARKKRIVRRKRRFSEREVMRIKRKLKKSARKLRLGAKRTGAYVYGTLRRIVGNPKGSEIITKDHEYYDDVHYVWRRVPAFWIGTSVASHAHKIRNFDEYQRDTRREAIRRGYMPKEYLSKAERRLVGNPGGLKILGYRSGMQYLTDGKDVYRRDKMDMKHGGMKWYSTYASFPASIRAYGPLTSPRGLRGNPSVTMQDIQRIVGKINSEGGGARVVPAGSGGLNLYLDRISPYDDKIIDVGHEYLLRGTKKDIYEALIKIRFVPMYHPYARKLNR